MLLEKIKLIADRPFEVISHINVEVFDHTIYRKPSIEIPDRYLREYPHFPGQPQYFLEAMPKSTVTIIGAGLGGLFTGVYAQMNGYHCLTFEHGRHPGGVAAEWKRQGYTIDGGIHFYMGYRPGQADHDIYRELDIYQEEQYFEMTTYGRFLDPSGGRSLEVTQDLDQLAATLKDISPKDAAFIDKILVGAKHSGIRI